MKMQAKPFDLLLRYLVWASAVITFGALIFLIGYIVIRGIPHLRPELFSFTYTADNVSMLPPLITTALMIVLALLIAAPLGIFTAIYLVEYAKKDNKLVKIVRVTAETLAGIPSIVYGLFGMLFFVVFMGWGYSLLSGGFTLAIMILPLIMRTTEESLKSVPDNFREGSFGLGAGRLRTVFRIVLPSAAPGILAGIILATGRIAGETAALIYTAGTMPRIPDNLFASGRTLSIHMFELSKEGFYINQAYATAVVLLILVVGINTLSAFIAKKIVKI